ncbi:MAG: hypothetical protein ABSD59_18300 [Terracidiphilus sp.]
MTKFVVELNGKTVKTFEAASYKRLGDQFIFFDSQSLKVGTIIIVPGMSVARVEGS